MGLIVTLAGQDITDFVDEPTIQVVSVLGQGAGAGSEGAGQATTAEFIADLGPIPSALGAGQAIPTITFNLFSANQSSTEDPVDTTEWGGVAYTQNLGTGSIARDTTKSWTGAGSLKVVTQGVGTFESLGINIPASEFAPSATYTVSAYLMATVAQTPDLRFFVEGNDGIAGNHALSATSLHATPVSGSWTRYQVTFTMPAVITDSYIGLRLDTGGTAQAITFWMDGLQFERAASATAWHLGRTTPRASLVRQGEVTITDATGTLIFGGYATLFTDQSLPTVIKTKIDCHDYMQDLDRVEVNEVYIGRDDIYIINDIMTKYAPWIDLSALPGTGTYTFDKRYVRAKSVREALQKLAVVTGYMVWITPDKKLHYSAPTDASTAPFTLSDNPDFSTSFGYDFQSDGYVTDDTAIINRVYFYGGKQTSPDFTQDLRVQANGANKVFQLAYYPHGISTDGKVHVIKNGTELVVGSPFDTTSLGKLISDGGTADVLLNADAETLTFDTAPATGLTQLDAQYRYNTPLVVVVSDKASFQFYGDWYDGKLDDSSVLDATTAIQRARVLLAQQNFGLTTVKLTTWQGGLQAGMLASLTNELRGLSGVSYLVQKVTANPLGAGFFSYDIELGAWNYTAVDVLFAAARRAGVQDTTTEEDTSVVQAQETLEGSDVAIVINLTTMTSGGYYSRTSAVGDGHDAYSGFFTITS